MSPCAVAGTPNAAATMMGTSRARRVRGVVRVVFIFGPFWALQFESFAVTGSAEPHKYANDFCTLLKNIFCLK